MSERMNVSWDDQASLHGNPIRKAAAVPPIPAAATGHKETR